MSRSIKILLDNICIYIYIWQENYEIAVNENWSCGCIIFVSVLDSSICYLSNLAAVLYISPPLFSPLFFPFFFPLHLVVTRRKKARRGKRRRGRRGDWIESIWKFDRRKTRKVHYQFLDRNRIAAHVEYKYIFLPISVSMGERNVYTNTRQFSRYPWNITPKAKNSTSRIGFDPQPARPPQPFSITRYSIVRVCAKGELLSGNSWSPNTLGGGAARLY